MMWWMIGISLFVFAIYLCVGANMAPYDYGGWIDGWQYLLILIFWLPLFIWMIVIRRMEHRTKEGDAK